jgi:hypothetical protein
LRGVRLIAATIGLGLALAGHAQGRPRVTTFACQIGGHRTGVLVPRADEEDSDDELECQAVVAGLGAAGRRPLAAELRVLPPRGPFWVVGSAPLNWAQARPDEARLPNLFIPHLTWSSGVDWRRQRAPRVRLELRVFGQGGGPRSWRLLASRRLELGAWVRR